MAGAAQRKARVPIRRYCVFRMPGLYSISARCPCASSQRLWRRRGFGGVLFPVSLRMNAEFMPVRLGKVHVVVARSLLNVRERQGPILIGNVDDLIKSCDGVAYVLFIG
jgi:hypothetical protein